MTYRITTKAGRLSEITRDILTRIAPIQPKENGIVRFYTVRNVGLGTRTHYSSAIGDRLIDLLCDAGMDYTSGNDAPKGGRLGEYVEFNKAAFFDAVRSRLTVWPDIEAFNNAITP